MIAAEIGDERREALSQLAESFPSLRGAPGVRPFDAVKLAGWALPGLAGNHHEIKDASELERAARGAGASCAAFVLSRLEHPSEHGEGVQAAAQSWCGFELGAGCLYWTAGDVDAYVAWLRAEHARGSASYFNNPMETVAVRIPAAVRT